MIPKDYNLDDYHYELPKELIATRPCETRSHSRLLVYDEKTDSIHHTHFYNLANYLPSDALVVLNNSKVFPCRINATKRTGGSAEIFFHSPDGVSHEYKVLIKARGKKNIGDEFFLPHNVMAKITSFADESFIVRLDNLHIPLMDYLEQFGMVPIPPYIRKGNSDEEDKKTYQTTFAKEVGSTAAPTAGLHFTSELLDSLNTAYVTLHVGMGTFKPVTTPDIRDFKIHEECFSLPEEARLKILESKNVFAVGTTTLRTLETTYLKNQFKENIHHEMTSIFLYPGKEIYSVRGLITNFHLPKSSLLMLVSAMIGREKTLSLYAEAIRHEYRFFSYGDAMLILRK